MGIDDDNGAGTLAGPDDRVARNTDQTLWVEPPATPFAPQNSIHVTEGGGIGIQVGGTIIVKPLRDWFDMAASEFPKSMKI